MISPRAMLRSTVPCFIAAKELSSIIAPTLAIAGADDPATPPAMLQEIASGVKDGRLLIVSHAAHLANAEQPDIITRAVIEHLEQS